MRIKIQNVLVEEDFFASFIGDEEADGTYIQKSEIVLPFPSNIKHAADLKEYCEQASEAMYNFLKQYYGY